MPKEKDILVVHKVVRLEFSQGAREERDFVSKPNVAARRPGAVSDSALFTAHDNETGTSQPVNEFAVEIWLGQGPLDRRAVKPLHKQDRRQLARIADRNCNKAP